MSDRYVQELRTVDEWLDSFFVMSQLRTHLDRDSYIDYLHEMTDNGYHLFAAFVDDKIVSLIGIEIQVNMYYGRHTWVHELVTDEDHRSLGHGSKLISFVKEWAKKRGCQLIALSSGLQREDAHRFYQEQAKMERTSYVYKCSVGNK